MLSRICCVGALALLLPVASSAAPAGPPVPPPPTRCDQILDKIGKDLADVTCFVSTDLTTTNPLTTPANNSIATLPAGAFTPITDRGVIAPSAGKRPPILTAVPGIQIQARIASDPTGQARFLLRLPDSWNGRLVVAGASGTRSEYNGDFAWSDYVVQKGYAYASQNKGVLNLTIASLSSPTPPNATACRLNPASGVWVNFYDNGAGQPFTRWTDYMIKATQIAQDGVKSAYGNPARFTYAVGTSNGGYQVRRALEAAPRKMFDGGVDWEGTFVHEGGPNLLTDLPAAVLNWPDYSTTFDPNSTAAKNIIAAGYAPDIVLPSIPAGASSRSLWGNYSNSFWEVTECQWQKRLDPDYDTYGSGTANYNYTQRRSFSDVGDQMAAFANTGNIRQPLITVAGTMDSLLPIDHHARAYARMVEAAQDDDPGPGRGPGPDPDPGPDPGPGPGKKQPAYRLYEVQNGNHIETYQDFFPQLELIMPHARRAFDLLVSSVEQGVALPPDQCIPRGGSIASVPAQAGHCPSLFVP